MNWYLKVLRQYADFNGRASRKEYWMFFLFNAIFSAVTMILDKVFDWNIGDASYGILNILYNLVVFIPSWAVSVRRLHDIGKSGWVLLMPIIASFLLACAAVVAADFSGSSIPTIICSIFLIIIFVWLLVLFAREGDVMDNKYGHNPKFQIDSTQS